MVKVEDGHGRDSLIASGFIHDIIILKEIDKSSLDIVSYVS